MQKEKVQQAAGILNEMGIDMWLSFGREAHTIHEPALDLILGTGYTWQSAFIITADGDSVAIVGSLDRPNLEKRGVFKQVIPYVKSIREPLLEVLSQKKPNRIALNYSENDCMADGLTHGMYLTLQSLVAGSEWADRFISSQPVVAALRGRKSPTEIERIRRAIEETQDLYHRVTAFLRPGRTEKEVQDWFRQRMAERGLETAWDIESCPSVFTGMPLEGAEAHVGPSDRVIQAGDVLNMDFGLKINLYCSDLQRTWYMLKPGQTEAPPEVIRGFEAVRDAIAESARAIRPGMEGRQIDHIARQLILDRGYQDYPHALGHQVGRSAHDGGGLLCPEWERYGNLPYMKIEENQVYTLEPRVRIDGYGTATMEEIIRVTSDGGEFISDPQRSIWLVAYES
ncbi:MAG: aminopeptidase P family protein [Candidatus Delongbacteria bacterium]|nr:aminopeptidase P family protein [Candidatus Delongbacteria bacterium]